MGIKTGIGTGPLPVLVGDSTILVVTDRVSISAANIFNNGPNTSTTVLFYSSPDETSGNGTLIGWEKIGLNEDLDVTSIIGQGYALGENIVAVADFAGVNCSVTYTQFTGGSV